jgi:hypothetical protein
LVFILSTLPSFTQILDDDTDSAAMIVDSVSSNWKDESDSIEVYYYVGNLNNLKLNELTYIDTTMTRTHEYDSLTKGNRMYSTLSNIGLAHVSLNFEPDLSRGFTKSLFYFNHYLVTNDEVRYYKLSKPYTEIFYVMGAKKEQDLRVVFSRDLYKGLNIGLDFSFTNSPGNYSNSKTNNVAGFFNAQYVTPDKRYRVIGNYLMNKLRVKENGGLVDDKYFTNNLEHDRSVIPIQLPNAKNEIRESGFYIQQQFNLTSAKKLEDTSRNMIDLGSLNYSIQYKRNIYMFWDDKPLSDFYSGYAPPIDSTGTFDSTTTTYILNKIGWSSLGYQENGEDHPFYLYANLNYDHITETLPYDSNKTTWNQVGVSGGMGINIKESFYLKGTGYLYFSGYNQGDFGIKGTINQYIGNKEKNYGELVLGAEFFLKTPWRFYQQWNSNRFRWSNNFDKESYLILNGHYSYKFIRAGINFYTIGNYTYLDDSLKPQQIVKALTITQFYAGGVVHVGKFGFDTKLVYQTASQTNVIRLPQFTGTLNLFFKTPVFKKAATIQTGIQLRYFTEFYAYGYMPELRAFYTQNDVKIGNYLWGDLYVTMKIQRARIFMKMANVTGYFEGYKYFNAPHYPDRDARFYFGVSWRFHD